MPPEPPTDQPRQRIGRRIRQVRLPRQSILAGILIVALVVGGYMLWRSPSMMPDAPVPVRFFQIATGSTAGTYYPVGEVIAAMISEPSGGEPCAESSRCGVPGLLAVVKSSQGSVDNVENVSAGIYDAALAQADITFWAFNGEGIFADDPPLSDLRAIAALYPEAVQLVAAKGAGVSSPRDLAGRRVSIDLPGSGTRADALLILRAFGLGESDLELVDVGPASAVDLMARGELDAFFLVAGAPAPAVSELVGQDVAELVPITGPEVDTLRNENQFFARHVIDSGTYRNHRAIATLSVKALLVTSTRVEARLIRDITAALWRPGNRQFLVNGHPKGRLIRPETALEGVPIPLHRGAERYYREAGIK